MTQIYLGGRVLGDGMEKLQPLHRSGKGISEPANNAGRVRRRLKKEEKVEQRPNQDYTARHFIRGGNKRQRRKFSEERTL